MTKVPHLPGASADHPTRKERSGHKNNVAAHGRPTAIVQWAPERETSVHQAPVFVYCDPDALKLFRASPTTVPLVDVVDSYDIFVTSEGGGTEGVKARANTELLESYFGKARTQEQMLRQILTEGKIRGTSDKLRSGSSYVNRQ